MRPKNSDQIAAEQRVADWNSLPEIERLRESNRILLKRLRELETPRKEMTERIMTYQDEIRMLRERVRDISAENRQLRSQLRKAGLA